MRARIWDRSADHDLAVIVLREMRDPAEPLDAQKVDGELRYTDFPVLPGTTFRDDVDSLNTS